MSDDRAVELAACSIYGNTGATWDESLRLARIAIDGLDDHRIIGPDDLNAIRNVLIAHKAAMVALNALWEGTASSADNHDDRRLAALIGDE
jgi:hypothetical protein